MQIDFETKKNQLTDEMKYRQIFCNIFCYRWRKSCIVLGGWFSCWLFIFSVLFCFVLFYLALKGDFV